jgi:acetyltransferase-like isoleucine patch superfamily enzyme
VIKRFIRYLALERNRAVGLYRRINRPNGREWATYLRRHGQLFHIGSDCSILPSTRIIDPWYTWIGSRVCLGTCILICHDGSIEVLEQRYKVKVDRLAPIVIRDDVYVGEGAMILGGTTIGEGSIIGAGAVLRKSVPPGSVVTGNPAKVVARVEDLMRFWEAEFLQLPWADLIARRVGAYDPQMEPELRRLRQSYFFKSINGPHDGAI